jgi:hypothetical protein
MGRAAWTQGTVGDVWLLMLLMLPMLLMLLMLLNGEQSILAMRRCRP